jgi:hypothetical protein
MGLSDDTASDNNLDLAFDDILNRSSVLGDAGISTSDGKDQGVDNASDDDLDDDESSDGEDKADGDDTTGEDDDVGDDDSTEGDDDDNDSDDDEEGDIDFEFEVPVKVDGEESKVNIGELVKGYQTSQHLSKKGRELANERKEFEATRDTELKQVKEAAKVLKAQSAIQEESLAKEYSELQEAAKAAKKDGDRYKSDEIKDKMEEIQSEYWKARNTREKVAEAIAAQEAKVADEKFDADVARFNEEIGDYIPDFDAEKATAIREFAISKGIPEEVLSTLADARIIGALNEFMEISTKVQKGSAKRKAAPKRTPSTTKKATPTSEKRKAAQSKSSSRLKTGEADSNDVDSALDALVGKYF